MIRFIVIALLVSACGRHVDPEFIPYLERFNAAAAERFPSLQADTTAGLSVVFGEPRNDGHLVMASCNAGLGGREIVVQRAAWDIFNDDGREQLLFHELGHCVLGRDHRDDWMDGNPPRQASIMAGISLPPQVVYAEHRREYLDELFGVTQ